MSILGAKKLRYDANIAYTHVVIDSDDTGEYRVWWNNNVRVAIMKLKDFDLDLIKVWINKNE